MTLRVLHVVRRFGCVGGMETYVWYLTHELVNLGVSVEVLCQSIESDVDPKITLHRLQPSLMKRRWKAMRDFRAKCDEFWRVYPDKDQVIVHSHERCSFHHISTFHGPPMPPDADLNFFQRFSPRIKAWKALEIEEISGEQVERVVPVSSVIKNQLMARYPTLLIKFASPVLPGLLNPKNLAFRPLPEKFVQSSSAKSGRGKVFREPYLSSKPYGKRESAFL